MNYPIMRDHFLTMNVHTFIFWRVSARPDGENLKTVLESSLAKDSVVSRATLRRDYFGSCFMVSLVVMICLQSMRFFAKKTQKSDKAIVKHNKNKHFYPFSVIFYCINRRHN